MKRIIPLLVLASLEPQAAGAREIDAAFEPLPAVRLEGRPFRLRCEHRENPLGIDRAAPRLSWWVGDPRPNAMQGAYQVQVASTAAQLDRKPDVWDSGKVTSDQSVGVAYAGPRLKSQQRYHWRVRTWDSAGSPSDWSKPQWWEMGLLDAQLWKGKWIGAPARDTSRSAPAVYLRREFAVKPNVVSARLYVTAGGIFEMSLNGKRVGEDLFTPGWTDYRQRNQYLTYDVTSHLAKGANVLGGTLADGWHNGHLLLIGGGKKNWYGDDTSLLAQLVVTYRDGSTDVFATDESWRVSVDGPIRESDLYNGEIYDARRELVRGGVAWDAPGYDATAWPTAAVRAAPPSAPVAKVNLPVRRQETRQPKSVRQHGDQWIFDFGQNMSGWTRLKLRGKPGQTVSLVFAEMLEADRSLHRTNMRSARTTDTYTYARDGVANWEPRFSSKGFRYVALEGADSDVTVSDLEAVVINNDLERTGHFETSDAHINQLQHAIWWSQRGNAFDVPTDCPQRDERLGWTGDANFFLPTGTFNYDVAAFIDKWMGDVRDAQGPKGEFPVYAPAPDGVNTAPAYSDGGIICPWIIYERYADAGVLADNYPAMQRWVEFQKSGSEGLLLAASGYGDWLAPGPLTATPKDLIATAYFAHGVDLMSRIAMVLGKADDAARYRQLRAEIGEAFRRRYVNADGMPIPDSVSSYAIMLEFDLLPPASRKRALDVMIGKLRARNWKAATGFVGTPILMRVLKRYGADEAAYGLLLNRDYPGWLYMIDLGATTIWERWNSWTRETGFGDKIADTGVGDVKMNSFNHTVWGAVGEWMYATIGGIDVSPRQAGYKHILIRPRPGGPLTWARATLDSAHGRIATHWKRESTRFVLEATVPPNTRATISMPDGTEHEVGAGKHTFTATMPEPERPIPTVADFRYGNDSVRQTFDFWKADTSKPAPLVLLLHGGGWVRGDKTGYGEKDIRAFLDAGISVAAVNYRFIPESMHQGVQPPVCGPLFDAARALQTLRAKAKEWNIDPNRIGATGGSAGACTALWLALHRDLADPGSKDPIARQSTRLAAVAVNGAQVSLDPVQLKEWIPNSVYGGHAFGFAAPGRQRKDEFKLLLESREEVLPWIREYSPIEHVSRDDPPIFLDFPNEKGKPIVGQNQPDPTHSAVQGLKLAESLSAVGVEAVVNYPAAPDEKYGSIEEFLKRKL